MSKRRATSKEYLDVALSFLDSFCQAISITGFRMVDSCYIVHDRRQNLIKRLSQLSLDSILIVNVKALEDSLIEQSFCCIISLCWLWHHYLCWPASAKHVRQVIVLCGVDSYSSCSVWLRLIAPIWQ